MPDLAVDPQLILQHIEDGLLIVDVEGRVLYTNSIFAEMVGREGQDLAGMRCCDLKVGAFCREYCPVQGEAKGSCQGAHFNVQVERGGRSAGAFCFLTTPVHDREGRLIGYMENFRGMDRVRDVILQLEEVNQAISLERAKTEDLIDSLADGVFSVDQELNVRRFSRNMEQMLGIGAAAAIGRPCRDVLQGSLCDTDCPLVWSREHGKPVTGCRETLHTPDGRSIPVTINTGFLRGEPDFDRGLFGVVTDRTEVEGLRQELEERAQFHGMIGRSEPMKALFRQIEAVGPTEATVLVTGESGTGKELVARALHRQSARAAGPFVSVNCAALVDDLLESELFGHVRGAFTGAMRDRQGRFEQAAGGTLFLDEVGDTSPALQAKLLRALQEKTIVPVGSGTERRVDVRIVAATNKDLLQEVHAGRFREDLYYRLNVIPVHVPALRERRDDIPLLVTHFTEKYARVHMAGREDAFEGISERALDVMVHYAWPGNVRELEHAVEYAMISSDRGRIERCFLPAPLRVTAAGPDGPTVAAEERRPAAAPPDPHAALLEALGGNRWNVAATAAALGISRTTLWRRMKELGISAR